MWRLSEGACKEGGASRLFHRSGSAPFFILLYPRYSKSPCISTGAPYLRPPINLDGLTTASLFTVGYRTNTKFFSSHRSSLLLIFRLRCTSKSNIYLSGADRQTQKGLYWSAWPPVICLYPSYECFTTTRPRLPPRSIAWIFSSRFSR